MKAEVQKEIGALRMAGITDIKLAVVPLARIQEDIDDALVELYESNYNENKNYTLSALTVHRISIEDKDGPSATKIITIRSNPVTIELEPGECESVDINEDTYEDVIVCYDEENGVTLNNIVIVDEDLESPIPEGATVISPITYSTVNEFIFEVDKKEWEREILEKVPGIKEIEKEIMKKYSPIVVIITIMLLYIIFVSSLSVHDKVRKSKKGK